MKLARFSVLLMIVLILACDAPRENPFDPNSSNYYEQKSELIVSRVFVKQLYPPFNPIANAQVIEPNLNLFGTTNAQGVVQFEHKAVDSLLFMVSAEPYFADTLKFSRKQTNDYEIFLNAKPAVENTKFVSFFNNIYDQFSITSIYMEALITDLDGPIDISSVRLQDETYGFDTLLVRDANNSDLFKIEFDLRDVSSDLTPEAAPELNFHLIVKNNNDDRVIKGPYVIKRVIQANLVQLSPTISTVTQDSVVFRWVDPELSYDYVFNIILLKFPTFEEIAYKGIPKGQTSLIVKNLSPGQYNWKLQVEDRLGNICQSNYIIFYHEQ
ncbi:hypothetical protein [Caldithrix abyssi]